ncbi:Tetraspanin-2 [Apostasia shenzhenica]|uniref:Tetraspanin-2 n=1 Tax=Apostasia shenzhenica TaxID=1088818 RepID=A0A2I0B787_9ASPA|nr:Tetraspanin-2 [Apostasia shenzhenica]
MALSNNIIAILNFLALLCSIPIIASGIWLATQEDSACVRLLRWSAIVLGILILLVALAGFAGAYWNHRCLLASYLICMAALIVLLLAFLVFAFVVTSPDGGYAVPGRAYREYRLSGFSDWLRQYIADDDRWAQIRACLSQSDVCGKLSREKATADRFFQSDLSPLQSGCCKPPTVCGFGYVNPTVWVNAVNPNADPDCLAWSNDQTQLCYGCNACKAGLIGNLRGEWRKANIAFIIAAVVLIWVYIIGCSALKNAQTEELFRRYKQGFT